jgi:hypothetical protein
MPRQSGVNAYHESDSGVLGGLEYSADPHDTIMEAPVLGLANGIDDRAVIDGSIEALRVDRLGHALINIVSHIIKNIDGPHSREYPKHRPR